MSEALPVFHPMLREQICSLPDFGRSGSLAFPLTAQCRWHLRSYASISSMNEYLRFILSEEVDPCLFVLEIADMLRHQSHGTAAKAPCTSRWRLNGMGQPRSISAGPLNNFTALQAPGTRLDGNDLAASPVSLKSHMRQAQLGYDPLFSHADVLACTRPLCN